MNKSKLKNSQHTHVRLIPPAWSVLNGYRLPQRDDTWAIESDGSDGFLKLRNISTGHVAQLGLDQIHHFDTDQEVGGDGIKRGFLTILVQISMEGCNLRIRPLPLYFRKLIAGKVSSRSNGSSNAEESAALRSFEKRLVSEFSHIDEKTVSGIRSDWEQISPSPQCPPIDTLMRDVAGRCVEGIKEREHSVGSVLMDCLNGFPALLTESALRKIEKIVRDHFPLNLYVATAANTIGVYQRRQAPPTKFSTRVFDFRMSLIKVDSHNRASHALANISSDIEELHVFLMEAHCRQ